MTMHRFDPISFVAGALFTLLGLLLLVPRRPFGFIDLLLASGRWVWPGLLLLLGLLILVPALRARGEEDGDEEAS